jgi:predicted Ser/Thr protein kinase
VIDYESAVASQFMCPQCGAALRAPSASRPADPLLGTTLGQYEILEVLGRGGMGVVYKAQQASLGRAVAIKVLPKTFCSDGMFIQRFGREARAAAAVRHPNIIEVYDIGQDGGRHYIAMEFIEGETLGELLKREGQLPPERALAMLKDVASALAEAHEYGVLHRDIKPANILIDLKGRVKVADFGLAKQAGVDVTVTVTGASLGTPLYMPPEISRGKAADARSDLYSLGATFYQALAGKPPFDGVTPAELIVKHIEERVPPLQKLAPDASPALCRVIHKLLRKKPEERVQSAEALLEALGKLDAQGGPHGAKTVTAPARAHHPSLEERRAAKRHKGRVGLIAGAVAAVAVAVVLFLVLRDGRDEAPQGKKPPEEVETPEPTGKSPTPPVVKPGPKPTTKTPHPSEKAPKPPEAPADPREVEAKELLEGAQRTAREGTWLSAETYLATLGREFADTKCYTANKTAIDALNQKVAAALKKPETPTLPRDKPDVQPKPPPDTNPIGPPKAEPGPTEDPKVAEAARKQRVLDAQWTKITEPVQARLASWDFTEAQKALGTVSVPPELADRLAEQKDQLARLVKLKAKMIATINDAKPPWKKSHLLLTGMNGDITKADASGITARVGDKMEAVAWKDLKSRSLSMLLNRCLDRQRGDDWIAGGLLTLAMDDPSRAEGYFRQAEKLGGKIEPYLSPLAEVAFARAKALLDKKQFDDAQKALSEIETRYGKSPWYGLHGAEMDEARGRLKDGLGQIVDAEAEKLYARAAGLYKSGRHFDLKAVVDKLRTERYRTSPAVTDAKRDPSFSIMAARVAKLGKRVTVGQRGKADFRTVQSAILAVPPYSLIEIQDSGMYKEQVVIPKEKEGLTIRGKEGCWPVITFEDRFGTPLEVRAPRTTLERMAIVRPPQHAHTLTSIVVKAPPIWFRSSIVATGGSGADSHRCLNVEGNPAPVEAENCLFIGNMGCAGPLVMRDCLWPFGRVRGRLELRNVTVGSINTDRPCDVRDSIIHQITGLHADTQVNYSCVYGAYKGIAKPGKGCHTKDPQFLDAKNFDYRLKSTSPCKGKASDGGDMGCRITPDMLKMLALTRKLQEMGLISRDLSAIFEH